MAYYRPDQAFSGFELSTGTAQTLIAVVPSEHSVFTTAVLPNARQARLRSAWAFLSQRMLSPRPQQDMALAVQALADSDHSAIYGLMHTQLAEIEQAAQAQGWALQAVVPEAALSGCLDTPAVWLEGSRLVLVLAPAQVVVFEASSFALEAFLACLPERDGPLPAYVWPNSSWHSGFDAALPYLAEQPLEQVLERLPRWLAANLWRPARRRWTLSPRWVSAAVALGVLLQLPLWLSLGWHQWQMWQMQRQQAALLVLYPQLGAQQALAPMEREANRRGRSLSAGGWSVLSKTLALMPPESVDKLELSEHQLRLQLAQEPQAELLQALQAEGLVVQAQGRRLEVQGSW